MLRRVTYNSNTPKALNDQDLLDLYAEASKNAERDELTGLTIYRRNSLFHVREGDPQLVSNSIVRASNRGWTYNVSIVLDDTVDHRLFDSWYLSFLPDSPASLDTGAGLIDLSKIRSHPATENAFNNPAFSVVFDAFIGDFEPQ